MRHLFVLTLVLCVATTSAAQQNSADSSHDQVSIRVQLIGLDANLELPENADEAAAMIRKPDAKQHIRWSRDFRGTTLSEVQLMIQSGESLPVVTGMTMMPNGRPSATTTYRETGTIIQITPRVAEDNRILLSVEVESSRLDQTQQQEPETPPIPNAITRTTVYKSVVVVNNGATQIASLSSTSSGSQDAAGEQAIILITASVTPVAP